MKSVFIKLVPLLLLAFLSMAPMSAQAQTPTGIRDGMFDCLGELDWGCRIISFLFEGTENGNNNTVTYWKDGQTVTERPENFSVLKALRVMMAFFSNALLIVASVKLIYELIQMVAETAQTGQVGGKDTNKLWAPIRLVVAIGLLVPLSSGLNSGQYIVLQMAKWGSGLASRAWYEFVSNLTQDQELATPTAPRIRQLASAAFKTYMCTAIANYWAERYRASPKVTENETVTCKWETNGNTYQQTCKNKIFEDICGTIKYKIPFKLSKEANPQVSHNDIKVSLQLAKDNNDGFEATAAELETYANDIVRYFTPEGYNDELDNTRQFEKLAQSYQDDIKSRVTNPKLRLDAMRGVTENLKLASSQLGWTSAGSWFIEIARAQGQLMTGALSIPEATGPNEELIAANYPSSIAIGYSAFKEWFEVATRPQDGLAGKPVGPTPTNSVETSDDTVKSESNFIDDFKSYLAKGGEQTGDYFFNLLDRGASYVGLWTNDPTRAFGDLGSSHDPFGEIAALGHRKIRLALTYLGYAFMTSAGSGALNALSGAMPLRSPAPMVITGFISGVLGKGLAAVTAILIMISTLFFMAGVLLAFIVPLFPFTRFFFAILQWLGTLMEAMILVPFMALGHLTPKGEGFSGPNTKNAYFMIFQVFLRPVLCTFGLILAMIMFYVAAKFLNASFYQAAAGLAVADGGGMRFIQKLVYSVMYVGLIYVAANICFKMIEHVPKHALKWMGGSANEESYDDHSNFMQIAAAVGGQQLISNMASLPEKLAAPFVEGASTLGQKVAGRRDAKLNFSRHNEGINTRLLSSGGTRDPSKKMTEPGAVSAPPPPTPPPPPPPPPSPVGTPAQIQHAENLVQSQQMYADSAEADVTRIEGALRTASPAARPALEKDLERAERKLSRHQQALANEQNTLRGLKEKA